jgi:transposase
MSTIPTSVTEEHFERHIRPFLSTAQRGYECSIPLYKVFNYILHRLHTGCQWQCLPIAPHATKAQKKKLVGKPSITIFGSGVGMAVSNRSGNTVLTRFRQNWH